MKYISLGRIGVKEYIEREFGRLITDEIIIMNERIEHIKIRHPEDYSLFQVYIKAIVGEPDYVIKDLKNENTIFMIKKLQNTNINVVVKVAIDKEHKNYKNSVITFYRIRDKTLNKLNCIMLCLAVIIAPMWILKL